MRAGDFVGAKIYRKPTEDKRTKGRHAAQP